jgi:hypothetical protein
LRRNTHLVNTFAPVAEHMATIIIHVVILTKGPRLFSSNSTRFLAIVLVMFVAEEELKIGSLGKSASKNVVGLGVCEVIASGTQTQGISRSVR